MKALPAGDLERLGQLQEIKDQINIWYEEESRKIVLQSHVDDSQRKYAFSIMTYI